MTAKPGPLMASLVEARRDVRVTARVVAAGLAVPHSTVSRWETGHHSPHWHYVVDYAAQLGRRIVARDGSNVLAEGLDVPATLTTLRLHVQFKQRDVADRLLCCRWSVSMFESRPGHVLASIERYVVVGLGLQLAHLEAA